MNWGAKVVELGVAVRFELERCLPMDGIGIGAIFPKGENDCVRAWTDGPFADGGEVNIADFGLPGRG